MKILNKIWMFVMFTIMLSLNVFADTIQVTSYINTETWVLIAIIFMFFLMLVSSLSNQMIIGILASIGLLILSINILTYSKVLGLILLAVSLILIIYYGLKES